MLFNYAQVSRYQSILIAIKLKDNLFSTLKRDKFFYFKSYFDNYYYYKSYQSYYPHIIMYIYLSIIQIITFTINLIVII